MNPNWYKACGKNIATFPFSPWKCKANIVISTRTLQKFLKWSENSVPKRSWGLFKLNRGSPVAAVASRQPPVWSRTFWSLGTVERSAAPSVKETENIQQHFNILYMGLSENRAPHFFGSSSLVLFFNGLKWWASSSVLIPRWVVKRHVPWTRGSNQGRDRRDLCHLATGCYSRKVTFERWVDWSFT